MPYEIADGLYAIADPIPDDGFPSLDQGCHSEHEHNNYCNFTLSDRTISLPKNDGFVALNLQDNLNIIETNFKPFNIPVYKSHSAAQEHYFSNYG